MADDVEYEQTIYKRSDKVEVYTGRLRSKNKRICIKILYADSLEEANNMQKESLSMYRFKDIDGIVTIYETQIGQSNNRFFVRVLMEYFCNGDLKQLIKSKAFSNSPWTEQELIEHLKQLVNVLAYLQTKGVAHQDIKPENIFVSDDFRLIVGDLGNAKEKENPISGTIAGTPLYLSPEMRQAYFQHLQGISLNNFSYDVYKSDIYSLGLTFLYMASLREPLDLLNYQNLAEKTRNRVGELVNYPNLQYYLMLMLNFDPSSRYDFITLKRELEGPGNSIQPAYYIAPNPELIGPRDGICCHCSRIAKEPRHIGNKIICVFCFDSLNQIILNHFFS
jgi:serine/threonine protein kinase